MNELITQQQRLLVVQQNGGQDDVAATYPASNFAVGFVIMLTGAFLAFVGICLTYMGYSPYWFFIGIGVVCAGFFIGRRHAVSAWLEGII